MTEYTNAAFGSMKTILMYYTIWKILLNHLPVGTTQRIYSKFLYFSKEDFMNQARFWAIFSRKLYRFVLLCFILDTNTMNFD